MARFNIPNGTNSQVRASSPIRTTGMVTRTHEGGQGYLRSTQGELFQLAVVNMVGQDTFYERGGNRDDRYTRLLHETGVHDFSWTFELLRWLRGPEGNLRTASVVGAAEVVKARLDADLHGDSGVTGTPTNRRLVDVVQQRGDEPGEMLGYWTSRYGRNLPQPLKRGTADAVRRLYTERAFLRYDADSKGFRFGDVIELVHPKTDLTWQDALFRHAINARHGHDEVIPELLYAIQARRSLNQMGVQQRHVLARLALRDGLEHSIYQRAMAGQWEWLHSSLGGQVADGLSKAGQWRLVLGQMGYMALLRNLRNLEEANLDRNEVQAICDRLSDPEEVAKSRQFPFRFWMAYRNLNGLTFASALETAVGHSMRNIPELPGHTLVLVDTSASMTNGIFDKKSQMTPVQAAALFGVAITVRNPGRVHLVGFASGEFQHEVRGGASMLRETERFVNRVGEVGHGTDIHGAVQRTFRPSHHDRVIIISDMQTIGGYYGANVDQLVPRHVPIYGFNLGGYRQAMMQTGTGNRHEFGGLNDATFKQLPLLECGEDSGWPWQMDEQTTAHR